MKKTKNFLYLFGIFLLCTLLQIVFLYQYSTKESRESITKSAVKQVEYASNQLNEKTKEIEMMASSLMNDQSIRFFKLRMDQNSLSEYDYVQTLNEIDDQIGKNILSMNGVAALHIYWPEKDLVISTETIETVKKMKWLKQIPVTGRNWSNQGENLYFSISYPYVNLNNTTPDFYIVVEMKRSYLNEIRHSATSLNNSKGLLRLPQGDLLFDDNSLDKHVANETAKVSGEEQLKLSGKKLGVISQMNLQNNVQVITYYNSGKLIQPITRISLITFGILFLILLIGLFLMHSFYKNIYSQVDVLIRKFKQVENGDLSVTIANKPGNEFNYVFSQFNQMISGIKNLLRSFESEQNRRSLAERKQLQAQINPHFLYNSLFYIISVSENSEAVREMTTHLAEYYKYRTKTNDYVSLEEESNFARSYLAIMSMRKKIDYEINLDEDIMDEMIIPLLIQPLLENAIQHGIEEKEGSCSVELNISSISGGYRVVVSDDGAGMAEDDLSNLRKKINQHKLNSEEHIGLWNVNHRLVNYYGKSAALYLANRANGSGLIVSFEIQLGGE